MENEQGCVNDMKLIQWSRKQRWFYKGSLNAAFVCKYDKFVQNVNYLHSLSTYSALVFTWY